MKDKTIKELRGGNLDLDLSSVKKDIHWDQDKCPWNVSEDTEEHKCAIKNTYLCHYFCGIKYPDKVLCCYPNKNPNKK